MEENSGELTEPQGSGSFRERFETGLEVWLRLDEQESNLTVAWDFLEGVGLPDLPPEQTIAPSLWTVIATDRARQHQTAQKLSWLLSTEANLPAGHISGEAYYNLFTLASEIVLPELLSEPLFALYTRWKAENRRPRFRGGAVLEALRSALAANQPGNRLLGDWQAMLQERYDGYLPGGINEGFHGIVTIERQLGEWPRAEIGEALSVIAHRIGSNAQSRHRRFRAYLDYVPALLGEISDWNLQLILLGDEYHWPLWSVLELPDFVVEHHGRFLIPSWWTKYERRDHGGTISVVRTLWSGLFHEVEVSEKARARVLEFRTKLAHTAAEMRLRGLASHRATVGVWEIARPVTELPENGETGAPPWHSPHAGINVQDDPDAEFLRAMEAVLQ